MAKLSIKNLRQVQSSIRKQITKAVRAKDIRSGVAEILISGIKDTKYGTPAKFTKEMREYLEPHNKTDPKYKRNKINATFTGELLQDLVNNVKTKTTGGSVQFIFEHSAKSHKPYKQPSDTGKGRKTNVTSLKSKKTRDVRDKFSKPTFKSGKSNRRIRIPYRFISTQIIDRLGYNYMDISRTVQKRIVAFIKKEVFNKIKKQRK